MQLIGVCDVFQLLRQINHVNRLTRSSDRAAVARLRLALCLMGNALDLSAFACNDS